MSPSAYLEPVAAKLPPGRPPRPSARAKDAAGDIDAIAREFGEAIKAGKRPAVCECPECGADWLALFADMLESDQARLLEAAARNNRLQRQLRRASGPSSRYRPEWPTARDVDRVIAAAAERPLSAGSVRTVRPRRPGRVPPAIAALGAWSLCWSPPSEEVSGEPTSDPTRKHP